MIVFQALTKGTVHQPIFHHNSSLMEIHLTVIQFLVITNFRTWPNNKAVMICSKFGSNQF